MQVANKRVAAAQQTRANLIETGLVLAEELGLEGLSVNAVVAGAGVSKGTFFHHFPDRVSYLVALHRRFHDVLFDEMMSAIADIQPGKDRLAAAATTYLDGCLRDRGVKALLLEARGHLPIAEEVTRRNRMSVDVVAADFEELGSRYPREAARLWIAATAECALMELERGSRDPAARSTLNALVPDRTGNASEQV
jgi:AcrR family transcriptional regulator